MTLVSIIVPTYNRPGPLMERAIPSILVQSVRDFEVNVVGDGTDQLTVDEMAALCHVDGRFRFWNLPHYPYPEDPSEAWGLLGLASLNHGLDNARGEWIAVLADDDAWEPDCLEVLLAATGPDVDHVYGRSDTIKHGKVTGQMYGAWPPGIAQWCNGANLYRASLGYRYDLTCRERGLNGDEDLWLRMIADGVRFKFVPKVIHHYHRNWP